MAYNFNSLKLSVKETEDWLKREFTGIRTGRANPALLDVVKVDAYGQQMTINQLANISIEDSRVLRIAVWDGTQTKAIEKGILSSNLGVSAAVDDKGIRVIFPELTSDRRQSFVKLAKQKLEEAKIRVRNDREKVVKDIDARNKSGEVSDDDKFRLKNELQKILDDAGKVLEDLFSKKEKEISE